MALLGIIVAPSSIVCRLRMPGALNEHLHTGSQGMAPPSTRHDCLQQGQVDSLWVHVMHVGGDDVSKR